MNVAARKMDVFKYSAARGASRASVAAADPVTTEVVRNALNSAANQMKNALVRTAFTPIIYEAHDFAVALYDDQMRMLSQAPTLPAFMGTMNFCVAAAVEAVGGAKSLRPGDVLIYNQPYGTGSHAQDVAIVAPIFHKDELIGYATNKAHWMDIGAMSIYCTNTTDVYQEGVVIPGMKIYDAGKLDSNVQRFIAANSRMPNEVIGDMNAQIAGARVGVNELLRLVERFGMEVFRECVERMFDHGEAIARRTIEQIPDGRYVARAMMDDNGLDQEPVHFELEVEVSGSDVRIDFSNAPDANPGPINCPQPSTVSLSRVTIAYLAGCGEAPNEGHFRPLEIVTRPGSLFHPVSPQPCYLYGWLIMPAIEAIFKALSGAAPHLMPAGGAADICAVMNWGRRDDGRHFMYSASLPAGHGGSHRGDGATVYIPALAFSRLASAELMESKNPMLFHRWEYVPDTAGVGKYRGGVGWCYHYEITTAGKMISTIDQTKSPAWAHQGGGQPTANQLDIIFPDGRTERMGKVTDYPLPAGTQIHIQPGGGGGYGPASERDPVRVHADLRQGLITEAHARAHYPHAFTR
jgi:N-methylhydantoinase B